MLARMLADHSGGSVPSKRFAHAQSNDVVHCQASLDWWRRCYNLERPHHALELNPPTSRHTLNPRPFPPTLPSIECAADDQIRTLDVSGRLSFRGRVYRVGKAFRGKPVAVRPTATDGVWRVFFSIQPIATIDLKP